MRQCRCLNRSGGQNPNDESQQLTVAKHLDRVRAALKDDYEIREELGSGGMATVFLARDIKHDRLVAVKVFRPELAVALGSSRFLREIEVIARLNHPHILPLFDSGEADGLFYYVMPRVEGESLRDRLRRDGQLEIEEAIAITEQVADALGYAHSHNVVHRDIKPENIMLSGEHASVTDFGIARAIDEAAAERLTETGLVIGTPAYMSPEQASGSSQVDGRSDVYSLGCVLFELLVGEPPFTGPTPQAILARQALETIPSVRVTRSATPEHVETAVRRALGKVPADRFRTAGAFAEALRSGRSRRWRAYIPPWARSISKWAAALMSVVAVAVTAVVGVRFLTGPGDELTGDPTLMAVMPFRASGTVDTTIIKPEELVGHLQSRFSGVGGPRVLDPALVLPAWQDAGGSRGAGISERNARRLARDFGAGLVLMGSIHGSSGTLSLNAFVVEASGGRELARAERVSAPSDSLASLLDRLAVELLLRLAGEDRRLNRLIDVQLPAIRAYVAGRLLFEAGHYAQAMEYFEEALRADSTFAMAGLAHEDALRATGVDGYGSGWSVAYAHSEQLDSADQRYLRYLIPDSLFSNIRGWASLVVDYPDFWEASYRLGASLFEYGHLVERDDPDGQARAAFLNVLEVRPDFVPALEQLLDLSATTGDLAEVQRISLGLLSADTLPDRADYVRWLAGTLLQDSVLLGDVRDRLADLQPSVLDAIAGTAQMLGVGIDEATEALDARRARASDIYDFWDVVTKQRGLALNLGRPAEGREAVAEDPLTLPMKELFYVIEALAWDGNSALAAEAAAIGAARLAQGDRYREPVRAMDLCTVRLWRLSQGDTVGLQNAIETLSSSDLPSQYSAASYITVCESILDARLAFLSDRPDAVETLDRLDALMRMGPAANSHLFAAGNLTVALLREQQGDIEGALAAVRRRTFHPRDGVTGLTTLLREEGRLAALLGERDAAISAYRHYLALRYDPEPSLVSQVAGVAAELNRLLEEPARR